MRATEIRINPDQLTQGQFYAVEWSDITLGEIRELESAGFEIEINPEFKLLFIVQL